MKTDHPGVTITFKGAELLIIPMFKLLIFLFPDFFFLLFIIHYSPSTTDCIDLGFEHTPNQPEIAHFYQV